MLYLNISGCAKFYTLLHIVCNCPPTHTIYLYENWLCEKHMFRTYLAKIPIDESREENKKKKKETK